MDDIAGRISELLSSAEGLEKIQSLAGLLGGMENNLSNEEEVIEQTVQENDSQMNGVLGFMNQPETLQMIMKVMPLLSSINEDDDDTLFIKALKPHLNDKRKKRADEAMKIMQLLKLLPLLEGVFGIEL